MWELALINRNIQLLRGISVLFVVFFHLDMKFFEFGYLGVDVFFVISGFLIPVIIHKYNSATFIAARFKRLAPALSVVIIATVLLGYLLNMPGEYESISKSALYSLLFVSPFYFLYNTGYFDQNALLQPLLHTWSLGNEFIAYILVSFFLLLARKRKNIVLLSDITAILSLFSFLFLMTTGDVEYLNPIPRLFLFFTAFSVSFRYKDAISVPSNRVLFFTSLFSLVILSLLFGDDILNHAWPNAGIILIPSLIIPIMLYKGDFIPIRWVSDFLVKIGDYSYSIYLVHWPLITFERIYFRNINLSQSEVVVLLVTIIVFSLLSYNFFERYTQRSKYTFSFCVFLCVVVIFNNGFESRVPKDLVKYSSLDKMINHEFFVERSKYKSINYDVVNISGNKNKLLIVGDSHSQHIVPIIKSKYDGQIFRIRIDEDKFNDSFSDIAGFIKSNNISKVLITYRVSKKNPGDLIKAINLLSANQKLSVFVLRDIPSFSGDPVACLLSQESQLVFKGCGFNILDGLPISKVLNHTDPVWSQIIFKEKQSNLIFIDSHLKLCEENCKLVFNNEFIMRDNNHLNEKLLPHTNEIIFDKLFGDFLGK